MARKKRPDRKLVCTECAKPFVRLARWTSGKVTFCGLSCYHKNRARTRRSRMPEYKIWDSMLRRCENPKHKAYKNYGGRGILVCAKWHDFDAWLADVGRRPDSSLEFDRVDNDGNYEPSNVRWTDLTTQSRNRRNTHKFELHGVTKSTAEWATFFGITHGAMQQRLHSLGKRDRSYWIEWAQTGNKKRAGVVHG